MKKTLDIINLFYKIIQILAKIYFVCIIVAGSISLVALITCGFIGTEDIIKLGDTTIHGLIISELNLSDESLYFILAEFVFFAIVTAVLSHFVYKYCKNELTDGTPFTERCYKETLRLSIIVFAVSLGFSIISGIAKSIVEKFVELPEDLSTMTINLIWGVILLFMYFIFRYVVEASAIEKNKLENIEKVDTTNKE